MANSNPIDSLNDAKFRGSDPDEFGAVQIAPWCAIYMNFQCRTVDELRERIRAKINGLRSIGRAVEQPDFARAFNAATTEQRKRLVPTLWTLNADAVWKWIEEVTPPDLEELSYADLRELAKRNHIADYSRLSKDELIRALKAKRAAS